MDPSATRTWLRTVLNSYRDSERTIRDVDAALHMYSSLKPKMDTYTYDNGHTQLLLCLYGTIPITYRSAGYNIPIAFWVPSDFPLIPPIPYVKPTRDMLIRPGKYVDVSGLCYHPYRASWKDSPDQHSLVQLVAIFQQIFTQEPPVYAKPPNYSGPQAMSPPVKPSLSSLSTSSNVGGSNQRGIPTSSTQVIPYPQTTTAAESATTFTNIFEGLKNLTFADSSANQRPQTQPENYSSSLPKRTSGPPPPPLPPSHVLTPMHAKLQQQLSRRLQEFNLQITLEIDELLAQNRQLNDAAGRLESEKTRLVNTEEQLRKNNDILRKNVEEMGEAIEKAKAAPDVGVDEGVGGVTVVYNQLFDLVAEENAIEDTIYYLGKALNSGRIDLNVFMKHTRSLATEQFQRRALIKIIRERVGLTM